MDIESDTRVRSIEQVGIPLEHVDSSGFTVTDGGNPGQHDPPHDWKGAFLLSMARGSWVNMIRGDLQPIQGDDVKWMARVEKLFLGLQDEGGIHSFGGSASIAGDQDPAPYGFAATTSRGSVFVVVNPGAAPATLALPLSSEGLAEQSAGRVQFRDAGFAPQLKNDTITLGPGQLAMVGLGEFAAPAWSLGIQRDVVVPSDVELLDADFHPTAPGTIEARIDPPIEGVLRVVVRDLLDSSQPLPGGVTASPAGNDASAGFTLDVTQSVPSHSFPCRHKRAILECPSRCRFSLARGRNRCQRSHSRHARPRARPFQSSVIHPNSKAARIRSSIDPAALSFRLPRRFLLLSVK